MVRDSFMRLRKIFFKKNSLRFLMPIMLLFLVMAIFYSFYVSAQSGGGGASLGPSLQRGLVGHWTMDEESYNLSTNKLLDKTPYGYNAEVNINTFILDRKNLAGSAVGQIYSNDSPTIQRLFLISHDNYAPWNFSHQDNFTLSAWMRLTSPYTNPDDWVRNSGIIQKGRGGLGFGINVSYDNQTTQIPRVYAIIRSPIGNR